LMQLYVIDKNNFTKYCIFHVLFVTAEVTKI
jgi:hypothetical protein